MGFSDAWRPEEQRDLVLVDKLQRGQIANLLLVNVWIETEVKALQSRDFGNAGLLNPGF